MAAPGARMRLTVVVEALAEENAHGDYRLEALAAFKERKFAMPVQLDDTFETVWSDIEQRYKTNYLNAQQAATFSIKKLQDAYDCDLDMTDTVGAIFEGEPDPKMRMIKVIPHFIYRETSVVPGSMLRPSGAQKRLGDDMDEAVNKRRRVESQQRQGTHEARDPSPNRPIASTELRPFAPSGAADADVEERSVRSKSRMSLVELSRTETGLAPFSSNGVKQESPEPEQPPALNGIDAASPAESTEESTESAPEEQAEEQAEVQAEVQPPRSNTLRDQLQEAPQQLLDEAPEVEEETAADGHTAVPDHPGSSPLDSQDAAIHKSPVSSVEHEAEAEAEADAAPAPTTRKRKDVYQVPSSPEFMHKKATPDKPARTYGRSPRSAQAAQRGAELLNMALLQGRSMRGKGINQNGTPASITKKARAFQRPQPDEIESTPQEEVGLGKRAKSHATNDGDDDDDHADLTASFLDEAAEDGLNTVQTPAPKAAVKPAKPGSLRKPSRASLTATPATTKRGAKTKVAATPGSEALANKAGAKEKRATPSTARSSKSEKILSKETTSRMEHLQKLLKASQNTPKRPTNTSSPAKNDSIESRDQSSKPSPEVRIPIAKKTAPAHAHTAPIEAHLITQPITAQATPIKSPVPLPPSIKKSTPANSTTFKTAVETPRTGEVDGFKRPAPKTHSPVPAAQQTPNAIISGTLRRSDVPLPLNVRHLRRSSSLQSSPLANGDTRNDEKSPITQTKTPASLKKASSSLDANSTQSPVAEPAETVTIPEPISGAIVISSAESSSTDNSDSENEERHGSPKRGMHGTIETANIPAEIQSSVDKGDATTPPGDTPVNDEVADKDVEQPENVAGSESADHSQAILPQTQDKPPSGQGSNHAVPWGAEPWSFRNLGQVDETNDKPEPIEELEPLAIAPAASASEDEGFAEQEIYSTAIEDNASRSRSASAAASLRSSPAVSRRPARFLSHSPTPDASESEDDSDEASVAPSQVGSPQAKAEDESETESSSDESDDEDVDMPNLPAESTADSYAKAAPPSSPPLQVAEGSTIVVPETSQSTPSQTNRPTQRTPIAPPTQQSSQAPRSSQSVSVQAADRRRYTGFRSLREQLADTKAAQAATQRKTFDPRTMSLGKLAKGKPPVGFGDNDDSSDDESSSSSSSSSDSD